jgi:DNA-binding transcriptional ArsR family regulator
VAVHDFLGITKALGDPSRLRILLALRRRELCVCQITELLRLAPSTVSRHLSLLQAAGLIESRKDERWVYYRWPNWNSPIRVREALDWVSKSLRNDPSVARDAKRLKNILRQDPKSLCQRQTRK